MLFKLLLIRYIQTLRKIHGVSLVFSPLSEICVKGLNRGVHCVLHALASKLIQTKQTFFVPTKRDSLKAWQSQGVTHHTAWQAQELSPFLFFFSYFRSCPMKFKLGEITGRSSLTNLYASPRHSPWCFITYATVTVAERDTPAWQCTRTPLPRSRASSAKERRHESC